MTTFLDVFLVIRLEKMPNPLVMGKSLTVQNLGSDSLPGCVLTHSLAHRRPTFPAAGDCPALPTAPSVVLVGARSEVSEMSEQQRKQTVCFMDIWSPHEDLSDMF